MTKVVSIILLSALLLCNTIALQTRSATYVQTRIKCLDTASQCSNNTNQTSGQNSTQQNSTAPANATQGGN